MALRRAFRDWSRYRGALRFVMTCQKYGTKFLKMFFFPHCTHPFQTCQSYMPVLCQEYMLFFGYPLSLQPRLNLLSTQQQGRIYTLGRGRASISVLSGPEILIWTNGPGEALRAWFRSGYLDQEGLKVNPGPDPQFRALLDYLQWDNG